MKILIILAILAVAYLVYRAATADTKVIVQPIEVETAQVVVEPEVESKKFLSVAIAITVGIVVAIAAAFLL